MTVHSKRFNKTILANLIDSGKPAMIKDSTERALFFKVGARRAVFRFEKRVRGCKGSPVTITIGAYPTVSIDTARQEARRLTNLCEQGIDPRLPGNTSQKVQITLKAAIDKFFEVKDLKPKSVQTYQYNLKRVPNSWMDKDITEITPSMLVELFHEIKKTGKAQCWEVMKLFDNIWKTCSPFFRGPENERILGVSPIVETKCMLSNVKRPEAKRSVINAQQLGKFVVSLERLIEEAPPAQRNMCDIALLNLFIGFRFAEAQTLKWENVDLENGSIYLSGDVTKNSKKHWVLLSTYPLELLKKRHREMVVESPYVFPQIKDPQKPASKAWQAYKRITKLIGSHYSPHTSRRTFASVAHHVDVNHLSLKRMLNHTYAGDVTGKYIIQGFNPEKARGDFQKVCDFILECRAQYLGIKSKKGMNAENLLKLRRYAEGLGLDLVEALTLLTRNVAA